MVTKKTPRWNYQVLSSGSAYDLAHAVQYLLLEMFQRRIDADELFAAMCRMNNVSQDIESEHQLLICPDDITDYLSLDPHEAASLAPLWYQVCTTVAAPPEGCMIGVHVDPHPELSGRFVGLLPLVITESSPVAGLIPIDFPRDLVIAKQHWERLIEQIQAAYLDLYYTGTHMPIEHLGRDNPDLDALWAGEPIDGTSQALDEFLRFRAETGEPGDIRHLADARQLTVRVVADTPWLVDCDATMREIIKRFAIIC